MTLYFLSHQSMCLYRSLAVNITNFDEARVIFDDIMKTGLEHSHRNIRIQQRLSIHDFS